MSRCCKNCSKKKKLHIHSSSMDKRQPVYYTLQQSDDYGLSPCISPARVTILSQDQYLLQSTHKAHRKVHKLEREMKKIKDKLAEYEAHQCHGHKQRKRAELFSQSRTESVRSLRKDTLREGSFMGSQRENMVDGSGEENSIDTFSRKREIGKFTKVSASDMEESIDSYSVRSPVGKKLTSKERTVKTGTPKQNNPMSTYFTNSSSENEDGYEAEEGQVYLNDNFEFESEINRNEKLVKQFQELVIKQKSSSGRERERIRDKIRKVSNLLVQNE